MVGKNVYLPWITFLCKVFHFRCTISFKRKTIGLKANVRCQLRKMVKNYKGLMNSMCGKYIFYISNWEFMRDKHGFHVFGKKYLHLWDSKRGLGMYSINRSRVIGLILLMNCFIIILLFFVQLPSWNFIVGGNIKSTIAKSQYVVKSLVFSTTLTTSWIFLNLQYLFIWCSCLDSMYVNNRIGPILFQWQ